MILPFARHQRPTPLHHGKLSAVGGVQKLHKTNSIGQNFDGEKVRKNLTNEELTKF